LGVPFSVNKNTKNPDLAAEYINWLVSRDSANQIAAVGQLTSAPLGAVEINPLLKDIATTFEQNNKNNTIGHYIDWAAPTLFDELGAASQELLAQRVTPEEFTARIEKVYADFLATRK
jgi:raffinose/stachyose/melibiose transport system substrate-binding protein